MTDLEALRTRWLAERELYKAFAEAVKSIIEAERRKRGLPCDVTCRAKEVDRLLKKQLLKKYPNSWDDLHDKAGVKIIARYFDQVEDFDKMIMDLFVVHKREDKSESLSYSEIGYRGIHYEVSFPEFGDGDPLVKFNGLICEIQLHTRAQDLWSDVSHDLIYKPPLEPPSSVKRIIYRLMSLIELFDEQVSYCRSIIIGSPGFMEGYMLAQLEKHYYRFTAKSYSQELSLDIISQLLPLFSAEEKATVDELLDTFVKTNQDKLQCIYDEYANDDRCNVILFQPESLLIFERMTKDPFRLKDQWLRSLPEDLLQSLGDIWGVSI